MKQCCENCQLFYKTKNEEIEYAWCCIFELHHMRFFSKEEYQAENECKHYAEKLPTGVEFVVDELKFEVKNWRK